MMAATAPKKEPAVSVIVPVFNVAPYLAEGLQILLQQDFDEDYEVILVDDGSTDDSLAPCRDFASRHADKLSLIECPANAGVGNARNLGLAQARGSYLVFFDPDDILPPSSLVDMFDAARRDHVDIVKGNLLLFDDRGCHPALVNLPDDHFEGKSATIFLSVVLALLLARISDSKPAGDTAAS